MARRRKLAQPSDSSFVDFDFEQRTYQIDPVLKKVYRRFVEIETSKASHILSIWRSQIVTV